MYRPSLGLGTKLGAATLGGSKQSDLDSYLKSLKKRQKEIVKKHQHDLGLPEEEASAGNASPTDEDSDLASLARELGQDDEFSPLDSPFIKKKTSISSSSGIGNSTPLAAEDSVPFVTSLSKNLSKPGLIGNTAAEPGKAPKNALLEKFMQFEQKYRGSSQTGGGNNSETETESEPIDIKIVSELEGKMLGTKKRKSSTSSHDPSPKASPKPSPKSSTVKAPTSTVVQNQGKSRIKRQAEEAGLQLKIPASTGNETSNFQLRNSPGIQTETGTMTPKTPATMSEFSDQASSPAAFNFENLHDVEELFEPEKVEELNWQEKRDHNSDKKIHFEEPTRDEISSPEIIEIDEFPSKDEEVEVANVSPKKSLVLEVSEKLSNDKVSKDKSSNDKVTNDKVTNDKGTNDKVTNDKVTNDKVTNNNVLNDNISKDKSSKEKTSSLSEFHQKSSESKLKSTSVSVQSDESIESQKENRSQQKIATEKISKRKDKSKSEATSERRKSYRRTSSRSRPSKSVDCVHCQNICEFHRKEMMTGTNPGATSSFRNSSTSRHYLFDPTADMLYNPWLGQNVAWSKNNIPRSKEFMTGFVQDRVQPYLIDNPMSYALSELLRGQLELTENFLNSQKKLYTSFVTSLNSAAIQQQQLDLNRQRQGEERQQQAEEHQRQQHQQNKEKITKAGNTSRSEKVKSNEPSLNHNNDDSVVEDLEYQTDFESDDESSTPTIVQTEISNSA